MIDNPLVCFKCGKTINKFDHYFEFNEILEKCKINTHFAHKKCWEEVKSTVGVTQKANDLLSGLQNMLRKQGMLPDKVVNI